MQPMLALIDEPHSPNFATSPNVRTSIRWKDRRMDNAAKDVNWRPERENSEHVGPYSNVDFDDVE